MKESVEKFYTCRKQQQLNCKQLQQATVYTKQLNYRSPYQVVIYLGIATTHIMFSYTHTCNRQLQKFHCYEVCHLSICKPFVVIDTFKVSIASISTPQLAEGFWRSHFLNMTLHRSSQLLGWSTLIMSSCGDLNPRAVPNSLHFVAQCGTTSWLMSCSLGVSFPIER